MSGSIFITTEFGETIRFAWHVHILNNRGKLAAIVSGPFTYSTQSGARVRAKEFAKLLGITLQE